MGTAPQPVYTRSRRRVDTLKTRRVVGPLVQAGDVARLRATDEPVELVAVLDASGTVLVRDAEGAEFEARRGDLETPGERHGCGCCG